MKDVLCSIPIYGRPPDTYATLATLSRMHGKERVEWLILYTEHEDLSLSQVEQWLAELNIEARIEIIERAAFPRGWVAALGRSFTACLEGDYAWCAWIESDNIVNPNWLTELLNIHAAASALRSIGMVVLHYYYGKPYIDDDPGVDYSFVFREHIATTAFLVDRATAKDVDLGIFNVHSRRGHEQALIDNLFERGRWHVAPKMSLAQHIGMGVSQGMKRWWSMGRGGVGFHPDPDIYDLWLPYNSPPVVHNATLYQTPRQLKNLLNAVEGATKVNGGYAECGVADGGSAYRILERIRMRRVDQVLHLFDVFTGFPDLLTPMERQQKACRSWLQRFKCSPQQLKQNLYPFVNIDHFHIHQGPLSETLPSFSEPLAFLHADCDQYVAMLEVFKMANRCVVPNGYMVVHDWGAIGVEQAVAEQLPEAAWKRCVWDKRRQMVLQRRMVP